MDNTVLLGITLFLLFMSLGMGLWVGFSLMLTAGASLILFSDFLRGDSMALNIWGVSSSWTLTALPLFIWMGELLFRTNVSENLFKGLSPIVSKLPGGHLHVNTIGSAMFAAVCGSSTATVATVGKINIPELRKRKYPDHMILGSLASSGTLGLMIPPSIMLIVYGVMTEVSISRLFMAGILPGLMLAGLFSCYIVIWGMLRKKRKDTEKAESPQAPKGLGSLFQLIPPLFLIFCVLGSIYFGVATPTEAAVLGVVGAIVIGLTDRSLKRSVFISSVLSATQTSAMIFFILFGSSYLSLAMGYTGVPQMIASYIADFSLSSYQLIFVLTLFYIILGCFLDGISCIVLTMAVIEPLINQAGINLIWFGIYLMVAVELAQITPPIGFNLFVLKKMSSHDLFYIAKSSFPFFLIMLLAMLLIIVFPSIVTFLPETMR